MKRISIYNRCLNLSPSGYYRILQYTNRLKTFNISHNVIPYKIYNLYLKSKKNKILNLMISPLIYLIMIARITYFLIKDLFISRPDVIIISRGLLPQYIPSYVLALLDKLKCPLIWDFDDDILLSKEISKKEFNFLCKKSKFIIVTHEYLKNKVPHIYWDKTKILPTTDGDFKGADFSAIIKKREDIFNFNDEIRLVWTGTAGNLINVITILPSLDLAAEKVFYAQHKKIVLYIISNDNIQFKTNFLEIQNIKWSRQKAVKYICEAHIGIMPLIDNEYSLGKGGFKLIQYMGASLPIIGSNIGYNSFIVKDSFGCLIDDLKNYNEWFEYINKISANWNSYLYYSQNSKRNWEDHFNYDENLKFWSDLIEKIA